MARSGRGGDAGVAGGRERRAYVARYLPALVSAAVVPAPTIVVLGFVDWLSALVVVLTLPLLPCSGPHRCDHPRGHRTTMGRPGRPLGALPRRRPRPADPGGLRPRRTSGADHRRRQPGAPPGDDGDLATGFLSSAALELLATICVAIVAVTVGCGSRTARSTSAPGSWRSCSPRRHTGRSAGSGRSSTVRRMAPALATMWTSAATSGSVVTARARMRRCRDGAALVALGLGYSYPGSTDAVLEGLDLTAGRGLTVVTGPPAAASPPCSSCSPACARPPPVPSRPHARTWSSSGRSSPSRASGRTHHGRQVARHDEESGRRCVSSRSTGWWRPAEGLDTPSATTDVACPPASGPGSCSPAQVWAARTSCSSTNPRPTSTAFQSRWHTRRSVVWPPSGAWSR